MKPDKSKSLEVYTDADYSGNWYKPTAADNASTAKCCSTLGTEISRTSVIWDTNIYLW